MKKNFSSHISKAGILLALFHLVFLSPSFAQAGWQEKNGLFITQPASQIPPDGAGSCGFYLNNKLYHLGGGTDYELSANRQYTFFHQYDLSTDKWSRLADLPYTTYGINVAFAVNGKGYVMTGFSDPTNTPQTWEYDPSTSLWTQKTAYPGNAKNSFANFLVAGKEYIVLGSDINSNLLNDVYEYDPATDVWTQKNNFPDTAWYSPASFSFDTLGVISNLSNGKVWEYTAANDSWSQKNNFMLSSAYNQTFSKGQKGYLCSYSTDSLYVYDHITDSWSTQGKLPTNAVFYWTNFSAPYFSSDNVSVYEIDTISYSFHKRFGHPKSVWRPNGMPYGNDKFYFSGNVYDASNDTWSVDPSIGTYQDWAFSINNLLYSVNGSSFSAYDPATHTWTPKANYPGASAYSYFSVNGKGYMGDFSSSPDFYEYDPVTDSWTTKAPFPGSSVATNNCFNIGNKGYIFGGWNFNSSWSSNEMWEYDPSQDQWTNIPTHNIPSREFCLAAGGNYRGYIGFGAPASLMSGMGDLWEYDPSTTSWQQLGNPLSGRMNVLACVHNDTLICGGGSQRMSQLDADVYYDLFSYSSPTINKISNVESDAFVHIYPNPVSDLIYVKSHEKIESLKIADISGKIVVTQNGISSKEVSLPMTDIVPGFYILTINGNNSGVRFMKTN